jgi:hypothetical protein
VRAAVCAIVVMLGVAACGSTGGESSGLHDHGGPNAANVALVDNDVIVDVTLDPAKVGMTTLHMEFAPPGGRLEKVGNVRALLTNSAGAAPIEVTLVDDGLNHFHADFELGAPGDWDVTIEAKVQGGAALSYRTTMTVGE